MIRPYKVCCDQLSAGAFGAWCQTAQLPSGGGVVMKTAHSVDQPMLDPTEIMPTPEPKLPPSFELKTPSDDSIDILVVAIQAAVRPDDEGHDLQSIDKGRQIVKKWLLALRLQEGDW